MKALGFRQYSKQSSRRSRHQFSLAISHDLLNRSRGSAARCSARGPPELRVPTADDVVRLRPNAYHAMEFSRQEVRALRPDPRDRRGMRTLMIADLLRRWELRH
jgi:hypothetical protein